MNFIQGGNGDTIIFGYSPVNEIVFRDYLEWGLSFKIGVNSLFNNDSDYGRVKIINYIGNRDMAIITAPYDGLQAVSDGPDLSFENTNGTWSTTSALTGARLFTDGANSAKYGWSVDAAESGKYIIIGGPEADDLTGAALLYARNGNNWNLVKKINGVSNNPYGPFMAANGSRYGTNTSINKSGDVTMINGPYDEAGAGGAIIYTGTNWITPAYKITGVEGYFMGVGADMNADGSVIILGGGNAPSFVPYDGHTNIFTGNKNLGWKLAQTITGVNSERLGQTCSINDNGDVIALASLNGYVALYTGNATNKWSLAQRISGEFTPQPGNNYTSSRVHNLSLSQDASVIAFSETESYEYNDITKTFIYTRNAQSQWSLDGVRVSDFVDSSYGEDVSVNAQGTTVAVYTRGETLAGYGGYEGAVNILKKI